MKKGQTLIDIIKGNPIYPHWDKKGKAI